MTPRGGDESKAPGSGSHRRSAQGPADPDPRTVEHLERALGEAERRQRAILDNTPDFAWLKDRDGRFIAANQAFASFCGLTPAALVGRTDFDLWPGTLAERYRADDREVVRTGRASRVEEPLQDPEGRLAWVETIRKPIEGSDGDVVGIAAIARDVSDRRLAEARLRKEHAELERLVAERTVLLEDANEELLANQERYRLAVAAGRVAVWDLDVATGEVWADPGLVGMLGYRDGEVEATLEGWLRLVHPEDRGRVEEALKAHLAGRSPEVVVEKRMVRKDGRVVWVETRASAVADAGGRAVRVVGADTEVTERKEAGLVLDLLHETDQMILRREPLARVLAFVCEEIARRFGLPLVWIGVATPDGRVEVRGSGGAGAEGLSGVELRWDDAPDGIGPVGDAIRTGRAQIVGDLRDLAFGSGKGRDLRGGIGSALVLPLGPEGARFGVLALCATRAGTFHEGSVALLRRFADQVALSFAEAEDLERIDVQTAALEAAANAVAITDVDGRIEWVNAAFTEMTGWRRDEVVGTVFPLVPAGGDPRGGPEAVVAALREGRVWRGEYAAARKDGSSYVEEQTVTPVRDRDGAVRRFIAIKQDVTARRRDEERLHHLALHDPLTELPNRQVVEQSLARLVARARRGTPATVALFDLDNFKLVNDAQGHAVGDQALVEVARFLSEAVRPGDEVGRLGDDEFVVLLEGTSTDQGKAMAERLRRELEAHRVPLGDRTLDLSVSVGLAPVDGRLDVPAVLALADAALAEAKMRGRNRVVVLDSAASQLSALSQASLWGTRIKDALEDGRFAVHYQPVRRLSTLEAVHHEALVRLCDEAGRMVPPSVFLPAAQFLGLVPRIDEWVLERVIEGLERRPGSSVFVNLSGESLGHEGVLDRIVERVRRSRIRPGRLGFEVTESTAVRDLTAAREWMGRLKELGCRFALDDFGIGFSSFAYLQSLPADFLKIDGTFVRSLATSRGNQAIVRAIVDVARALGKEVIAEWVESADAIPVLAALGVELGQGFALGRPAEELPGSPGAE